MTTARIPATITRQPSRTNTRIRRYKGHILDKKAARSICERLMCGESLASICNDPKMPSRTVLVKWLANPKYFEFRDMYYHARRIQAEFLIDDIVEIADNTRGDYKRVWNRKTKEFEMVFLNEHVQRSRVRIDTRKWIAAKMHPKIYGDKQQIDMDVTGDLAELLKSASNKTAGLPNLKNVNVIEHDDG